MKRLRLALPFLLIGLLLGAAVVFWIGRPHFTEERIRQTVLTTIQREVPASFLVTGTLDLTAAVTMQSEKLLFPGVFDVSLGTTTSTVRVPGRVAYGFDVRHLRAEMIRVEEDGTVLVLLPALEVFSVEPDLDAMQVQTEVGWARTQSGSGRAMEQAALRRLRSALRTQGEQHLAGKSVQPRVNTSQALEAMLRPALEASGLKDPRFRFEIAPELVRTTG